NRTVASDVTAARHSVYRTPDEEGNWWERMVATVKLERRNPMLQMLLRSSDIMQSILVDIHASLHPPDLRIRMAMPQYRIESFKDFEDIVAIGEQTAEAILAAKGGWETCMALADELEPQAHDNGEARGAPVPDLPEALPPEPGKRDLKAARQLVSAVTSAAG